MRHLPCLTQHALSEEHSVQLLVPCQSSENKRQADSLQLLLVLPVGRVVAQVAGGQAVKQVEGSQDAAPHGVMHPSVCNVRQGNWAR